MAILRMRDMKEMDARTMAGKLAELRRELSIERSSAAGVGRTVNPGRIRTIKRTIARIHTLARQKGFGLEAVPVAPLSPAKAETKPAAKPAAKANANAGAEAKPAPAAAKPETRPAQPAANAEPNSAAKKAGEKGEGVSPEFSELIDDAAKKD